MSSQQRAGLYARHGLGRDVEMPQVLSCPLQSPVPRLQPPAPVARTASGPLSCGGRGWGRESGPGGRTEGALGLAPCQGLHECTGDQALFISSSGQNGTFSVS